MSTTRLRASGGQPELNTLFQFDNSPAQQLPADRGSGFHFGFFGSLDLVVVAFLTKADHLLLKFLLGLAHAISVAEICRATKNPPQAEAYEGSQGGIWDVPDFTLD